MMGALPVLSSVDAEPFRLCRAPIEYRAPGHLIEALGAPTDVPLRIIRAPRGYGKSSLVSTWLHAHTCPIPIVVLPLDRSTHSPERFWQYLADRIDGPEPGPSAARRPGVDRRAAGWLADRRTPSLLVIDNFQEIEHSSDRYTLDSTLLDLLCDNDRLHLIALSRTPTPLESLGPLSVDSLVIGANDLRMTTQSTLSLAGSMGVDLNPTQASRLVAQVGGWPALVRAVLRGLGRGTGNLGTISALIARIVGGLVDTATSRELRTFILAAALIEDLDAGAVQALAPADRAGEFVQRTIAMGLLVEDGCSEAFPSFPPAVRDALQWIVHTREPQLESATHRTMSHRALDLDDPAAALLHAARAREWPTLKTVLDERWIWLLRHSPDVLVAVTADLPEAITTDDPRLRLARDHLPSCRCRSGPGVALPPLTPPSSRQESSAAPRDDFSAFMQWAYACLADGDWETALLASTRAHTWAANHDPARLPAGLLGAALAHALRGEPRAALQWLDDLDGSPSAAGAELADPTLVSIHHAIRALSLVDIQDDTGTVAVDSIPSRRQHDDLWGLILLVQALVGLRPDGAAQRPRLLQSVRSALQFARRDSFVTTLLIDVFVDLLLADGLVQTAARVLTDSSAGPAQWSTVAKVRLAEHRYQEAADAATRSIGSERPPHRFALDGTVALARAQYGAGHFDEAREALTAASNLAAETGRSAPLADVPTLMIVALHQGPSVHVVSARDHAGTNGTYERRPVRLTPREAQVLHALQGNAGPVAIAAELGLSANTVKTHVRSLYRKLAVTNREDALLQASRIRIGR